MTNEPRGSELLRLLLVRSPGTAGSRRGEVPADEQAVAAAPDLSGWLRNGGTLLTSPARRARVAGARVDDRLRPWDLGGWAGRRLDVLPPDQLAAWRHDPDWAGHGGEPLRSVSDRVERLLQEWHGHEGRVAALTHASVVRAAVLLALRAPLDAAWELDVRPGSRTELHTTGAGWRVLSVGCAA